MIIDIVDINLDLDLDLDINRQATECITSI